MSPPSLQGFQVVLQAPPMSPIVTAAILMDRFIPRSDFLMSTMKGPTLPRVRTNSPQWLNRLERYLGWLAVPRIGFLFITLQVFGFLFVANDPVWVMRLALIPEAVFQGEVWRLLTYLALPISTSPIWVFFSLWFAYFIFEGIEGAWGPFRTTLYVLTSMVVTILYSLLTGYPVVTARHFETTLFLAAAALFPDMEVSLFFIAPVKFKWLAWLSALLVVLEAVRGSWWDLGLLVAIFSNFILFFGPAALVLVRQWKRRRDYDRKIK